MASLPCFIHGDTSSVFYLQPSVTFSIYSIYSCRTPLGWAGGEATQTGPKHGSGVSQPGGRSEATLEVAPASPGLRRKVCGGSLQRRLGALMRGLCPEVSRVGGAASGSFQRRQGPLWPATRVFCWGERNACLCQPSLPPQARGVERGGSCRLFTLPFREEHRISDSHVASFAFVFFFFLNFRTSPLNPQEAQVQVRSHLQGGFGGVSLLPMQGPLKPVQGPTWVLFSE